MIFGDLQADAPSRAAMTCTRPEMSCKGFSAAMVIIFRTRPTSAAMNWETTPRGDRTPRRVAGSMMLIENPPHPDFWGLTGRRTYSSGNDLHAP